MKILITGGAGFIGSNLCEYFVEKEYDVTCLDNLSTGFIHNIEPLIGKTNFRFVEGDIRDLDTCRKVVSGANVVLHEAALGSVPRSINDPINTNSNNIDGFLNMLVAARDAGVQRFVYAASSSTYGDSKELPKIEHNIGRPLSPYAITKYVNELYANVFSSLYGIANQRNHDLRHRVLAFLLQLAGSAQDGAGLHSSNLGESDAQTAATVTQHRVVLGE